MKPIVHSAAVHPIKLSSRNSELPQELKVTKWMNKDINRMDAIEFFVNIINQTECLKASEALNMTVDFYGKNNINGRPIVFCTDGGFIEPGNSGTPAITTYERGSVVGLLSRGPTEVVALPNIFVDIQAFFHQLPEYEDDFLAFHT
ncbi:hypothetical protein ACKWTF_003485 [Chironomus riparius]